MSSATDKPRKALGKGLSALLPTRAFPASQPSSPPEVRPTTTLPISSIEPNPVQPRRRFHVQHLEELATSIRANGIVQPLIVRKHENSYQLVAGERRWRAAQLAGLTEVPVVVQDIADERMLTLALIENIQREDLNPVELATAYDRLIREMGLSHEEIARQTGKDRATISNTLRILKLPFDVQQLLVEQRLSMGHAKAILGLADAETQVRLAEEAVAKGLSVRNVEGRVNQLLGSRDARDKATKAGAIDPNVRSATDELERILGTRVRIVEVTDQRGRIEIEFYSQAELQRLYQQIVGD
jgi:ParB family chromosome partitioning protein